MSENRFDNWAKASYEQGIKKKERVIYDNNEGQIWKQPWLDSLMSEIEQNGDIDKFCTIKNQRLHDQYIEEESAPYIQNRNEADYQIFQLTDFAAKSSNLNKSLDNLTKDINTLLKIYPQERIQSLKEVLTQYRITGKFNKDSSFETLRKKPTGFFNKLKQGHKIKTANKCLNSFILKYQTINLKEQIDNLLKHSQNASGAEDLEKKFRSITDLDSEKSLAYSNNFMQKQIKLNNNISTQKTISENQSQNIKLLEQDFLTSKRIPAEDAVIRAFSKEIQNDILTPKILNSAEYIERLEHIPDNEYIMFNIGLRQGENNSVKINRILAYNGLQSGEETHQWMIRQETTNNSDKDKLELFSPLMTAKDAKEIMPKLIADLDKAQLSSSLIVPIKANDIFKNNTYTKIPPNNINEGLTNLIRKAHLSQKFNTLSSLADKNELLEKHGFKSADELPTVYNSIKEMETYFPKEKYLFSGSTASDDHLPISARCGRNGLIYATTELSYAAKYDGVTNIGLSEGTTATGDRYVSSVMGKVFDEEVKIGFINIYEQNHSDKFFTNFGMEDYRKHKDTDTSSQTVITYEPTQDGVIERPLKTAPNNHLTKEQALYGYIQHNGAWFTRSDGKQAPIPAYNAETYVTPEKNPLKAKIMHISWKDNEYFIPVPENPDEITQYILNSRQADMKDTFSHNGREDVLQRFTKQKEEFQQGIIHPMRSPDFMQKKQNTLRLTMEKQTNSTEQNYPQKKPTKTDQLNTSLQLKILRGCTVASKSSPRQASAIKKPLPFILTQNLNSQRE